MVNRLYPFRETGKGGGWLGVRVVKIRLLLTTSLTLVRGFTSTARERYAKLTVLLSGGGERGGWLGVRVVKIVDFSPQT